MIRLFGHYVPRVLVLLAIAEGLVFFVAAELAVLAGFGWSLPTDQDRWILILNGIVFAVFMSTAMVALGLYQRYSQWREAGLAVRLGLSFALATTALILFFYIFPSTLMGRGNLGLSLVISFVGVMLVREAFGRIAGVEALKRRLLVVGTGVNAECIKRVTDENRDLGFQVVGYVPLPRSPRLVPDRLVIPRDKPLLELAIDHEIDEIIVAADEMRGTLPIDELMDCRMSGLDILNLPSFFEKELALVRIEVVNPNWFIFSQNGFRSGMTGLYGKRLFDVIIGSLMLLVASPIMIAVAFASLIESRGRDPVLYHQVRVGENGKLFRLHKFRSMRVDAEADGIPRWAMRDDTRITPLGSLIRKTRIDELPQIFNVLKGQMSLVGPRPERPDFVEELVATIPFYAERHRVKPGVTGWAQLLYPYGSSIQDAKHKLEYDLFYVKNAGIVLDLVILLQTVEVVLLGKGAR